MVDVTVLTPSYNYGRFIEDALLSVRCQRGLSLQHVIQDGGSTDATLQTLTDYNNHIDWASEPDGGQSDALNRALSRATGRWIAWLNADEFYLPAGLAHLLEHGERSGADVVYGECVIVDEAGRVARLLPQYRFTSRVLRNYGPCISSCSAIFRRSVLGQDPWDIALRRVMDWDLYLRLMERGANFLFVPFPVGAFRIHQDQVTAIPWQAWQQEDEFVAARHGRPTDLAERWRSYKRARWLHRAHKVVGGSYLRERRARVFRDRDFRWFGSEAGYATAIEFLRHTYKRSLPDVGRSSQGHRKTPPSDD